MTLQRSLCGVLAAVVLFAGGKPVRAEAPDANERLQAAIELFKQGEYASSLAQLRTIDEDDLRSDEAKVLYQRYLQEAEDAVEESAQARRDFQRAEQASAKKDFPTARRYYALVGANQYAPRDLMTIARQRADVLRTRGDVALASLKDPADKPEGGGEEEQGADEEGAEEDAEEKSADESEEEAPPTATAPSEDEGDEAAADEPAEEAEKPTADEEKSDEADDADAEEGAEAEAEETPAAAEKESATSPAEASTDERAPADEPAPADEEGMPAVEDVAEPAEAAPPPGLREAALVDDLVQEQQLLWQQATKIFQDTEEQIRKAVTAENFEEASRLMDYARQILESNRRFSYPPSAYDDLRAHAGSLAQWIAEEHRKFDERQVAAKLAEIEQREAERRARIERTKQLQIENLMNTAMELRKERQYDEAIQVLRQVLNIDPNNEQAAWMKEMLEDTQMHTRQRGVQRDREREAQDLFTETDEAAIPWHVDLLYPKNWPEINAKRRGAEEQGETEATRRAKRKLAETTPEIKFDAQSFEQVIEFLRERTGLNIVPNWAPMEVAGIERDQEVTLKLTNVSFAKAIDLILTDVGSATETQLAYEIDDGVLQISTKEDLSLKTVTQVYNVQDLLVLVPNFTGLQINLQNVGQGVGQERQRGQAGGGGGGQGQGGQGLFQGGGQGQGGQDELAQLQNPLDLLVTLIQQTIDPESWREAGGNIGSIQPLNNQLIVTQTASAHSQIRDLLRQLREARALQIAVEARYIQITRNFLEQIGVDLDIVLNNGNAGFDRATAGNTIVRDPSTGALLLLPRQFSRLGFTPGAPGGVGLPLNASPNNLDQPYRQPGLVPAPGDVGPHSGQWTPIPITNNTLDLAAPVATNIAGSLGGANTSPALNIFGSFLDNIQVDFLLRATQVDNRSSDLDAPRLVLFNGQRAVFSSFIEQEYVSSLIPVLGDNVGLFQPTTSLALTGRQLDVQATVSADRRYVTMTIQTFTRVSGDPVPFQFQGNGFLTGGGFIQLVRSTTNQIRTTVSVPDGGTLLIGGLKQSGERERDAGVPILSRIPVLKRAFSNTSLVKDDQVLLILIKPKIIIQEEAENEAFPSLSQAQ
ncbi:MAG: hypothetical protein L6Q92_03005 [Phycisphaerae bacterium]|nr:hypothetical protein [Phycisphaerae bacterium]